MTYDVHYGFSKPREHVFADHFCDGCEGCNFKDCIAHDLCTCPKTEAAA